MINYKLVENVQFDNQLRLIHHADDPYLEPMLDFVPITWNQSGCFYHTTGLLYRIMVDDRPVGFCWVEVCGRVLRLHNLTVQNAFQNHGIGTRTLNWLEETFRSKVDEIELTVHASNPRAKALYERCGYETAGGCSPSDFYIMRKKIHHN